MIRLVIVCRYENWHNTFLQQTRAQSTWTGVEIYTTLALHLVLSPPAKLRHEEACTLPGHLPLPMQTNQQTRVHDGLPVPRRWFPYSISPWFIAPQRVCFHSAEKRDLAVCWVVNNWYSRSLYTAYNLIVAWEGRLPFIYPVSHVTKPLQMTCCTNEIAAR
jgi:hypothetical protein